MDHLASMWRSLSSLYYEGVTFFLTTRDWLNEHPQQLFQLITAFILLLGFFLWWKKTHRFQLTANQRAEQLLKQSLTPLQYQQIQTQGFLELPSTITPSQFYRIPRYRGRVKVYENYNENGQTLCRLKAELCIIPREDVPDADLILAHKWMIEGDERSYTTIANWIIGQQSPGWPVYTPGRAIRTD